jgi:hypothetical protein
MTTFVPEPWENVSLGKQDGLIVGIWNTLPECYRFLRVVHSTKYHILHQATEHAREEGLRQKEMEKEPWERVRETEMGDIEEPGVNRLGIIRTTLESQSEYLGALEKEFEKVLSNVKEVQEWNNKLTRWADGENYWEE